MKSITARLYNWYLKGQTDGVSTRNMTPIGKARFYLGSIFEQSVYNIIGHDKYTKWQSVASFFERWH